MDRLRKHTRSNGSRLFLALLLSSTLGCAANPIQIPTVWDKLGIPQATAALRDSTINKSGNFPGLEKKPPLLKIADPANLKPEKPEMIKVAAKIKAEQDQKKQKIKALKFLAEVNCGCYNKDDAVAKAFLAALDDCDPDVRTAAIEGLSKAAGNCSNCKTGCETTCCTEDIYKKLQDIACGVDAKGCFKEPVKEIRSAAAALVRKCPCPTPKPLEEVPAPSPYEVEELIAPTIDDRIEGGSPAKPATPRTEGGSAKRRDSSETQTVAYRVRDSGNMPGTEPVIVAKRGAAKPTKPDEIANPDQLIGVRVISNSKQLGEVLVELPDVYQLNQGWTMVVVEPTGKHQVGKIVEASGRRILIALESPSNFHTDAGQTLKIGLVQK